MILDKTPLTEIDLSETMIYKYRPSYEELEQELERYKNIIDKATKELETLLPLCIMPNNTLIHATEKSKIIKETIKILKGE